MAKSLLRVVVDTNVLVSGIVFRGNPHQILQAVIDRRIQAISSKTLLAELTEILSKKMDYSPDKIRQITDQLEDLIEIVQPEKIIEVCRDTDDNRVLEAAAAGKSDFIVTGDKDLLVLKKYKTIRILTPAEFVDHISIAASSRSSSRYNLFPCANT